MNDRKNHQPHNREHKHKATQEARSDKISLRPIRQVSRVGTLTQHNFRLHWPNLNYPYFRAILKILSIS